VSTRDCAGILDEVCDGYGIQKSSVSRHWKAASRQQLKQMLERALGDLDLCVLFLDGKEFHDFTLIVAMGVDHAAGGTDPVPSRPGVRSIAAADQRVDQCP